MIALLIGRYPKALALPLAWRVRRSWSEELAPGLPVLPAAIAEAHECAIYLLRHCGKLHVGLAP